MSSQCVECGQPIGSRPGSSTRPDGRTLCEDCRDATLEQEHSRRGSGDLLSSDESIDDGSLATKSLDSSGDERTQVAQFKLLRLLGRGSFGNVWLADDVRLGREVALKLPNSSRPEASTLLHEAKTAAGLRHPNIVTVYEVGDENGQIFIASEYIDGVTLRDRLTSKRPRLKQITRLLIPVTEALHFAHTHNVVHRDVKPANILLDLAGKPYVTDFGLAKKLSADETISSDRQIVGTVRYMSPEQATGKTEETDARSDIYAVGVMLFEMLTGESPFRGNARAILQQKVSEDPPSPRTLEPTVPRDLETICLKSLEREPEKRFQTASELAEELQRFSADEPIQSRPITRLERGWRWCKRRPAVSGLTASLFLALTLGLIGVSYFWKQSVDNAYSAKEKLYRAWMNEATAQYRGGSPTGVNSMLQQIAEDPDTAEMRGFGFRYLEHASSKIQAVGRIGNGVLDVAVSGNGEFCAATSGGPDVTVFDIPNRRTIRTLQADHDGFTAIAISPTTSSLVAGAIDGKLRVYQPLRDDKIDMQFEHGPPVRHVGYSPDGELIYSAGKEGAIRLFDSGTGKLLAAIPSGRGAETKAICFSPDGESLYVGNSAGRVRVWGVTGVLAKGQDSIPDPISQFDTIPRMEAMCINPDGRQLVAGAYDARYIVVDLPYSRQSAASVFQDMFMGTVLDLDALTDNHFVVTSSDGTLYVFNNKTGRSIMELNSHARPGAPIDISKNSKCLVIGGSDGVVAAIDREVFTRPQQLWADSAVRSLSYFGRDSVLAGDEDGFLSLWNLSTGTRTVMDGPKQPAMVLAVDPKRKWLATGGAAPGVIIRDQSLEVIKEIPTVPAGTAAVSISGSGELLAIAQRVGPLNIYASGDWDHPRFELPMKEKFVRSVAFNEDESHLAIATDNGIEIFDVKEGRLAKGFALPRSAPTVLRYCRDSTLVIGTSGGDLVFYDCELDRIKTIQKAHNGRVNTIAELSNSGVIATGGRDGDVELWDIVSCSLVTRFRPHRRQVFAICVSDDESTIV
ncbi:MAG: WD40 repeat domain-containing serine/threonine protein kinase, partial [Rubripirellula sp.]